MLTEDMQVAMLELPKLDYQEMKKEMVIERVQQIECSICIESLGHEPD